MSAPDAPASNEEIWARVRAHRAREDRLRDHPLGAALIAYERALVEDNATNLRIEASDWPSNKLLEKGRAAQKRVDEARAALVDLILGAETSHDHT